MRSFTALWLGRLEWWLSWLESYEYMLLVRHFVELMECVRRTSHCVELSVTLGGNGLIIQPLFDKIRSKIQYNIIT